MEEEFGWWLRFERAGDFIYKIKLEEKGSRTFFKCNKRKYDDAICNDQLNEPFVVFENLNLPSPGLNERKTKERGKNNMGIEADLFLRCLKLTLFLYLCISVPMPPLSLSWSLRIPTPTLSPPSLYFPLSPLFFDGRWNNWTKLIIKIDTLNMFGEIWIKQNYIHLNPTEIVANPQRKRRDVMKLNIKKYDHETFLENNDIMYAFF